MSPEHKKILALARAMKALGVASFTIDGLTVSFDPRGFSTLPVKPIKNDRVPTPTQLEQDEIDLFYSSTRTF